ncbi:type III secretion protein [Pseudomonas graminis]
MTSTFPPSRSNDIFRSAQEADPEAKEQGEASQDLLAPTQEYAAKARQMRVFASQQQFQAPVADDFSRGLLADGQPPVGTSLKCTKLINSLASWWRGQTSG